MIAERLWSAIRQPENVLDQEWDNLLILDACRYDVFRDVAPSTIGRAPIHGRYTLGSSTREFLEETFGGREHHDIVYVTANPQPIRFADECDHTPFHALVSVLDAWDKTIQTVPPGAVVDAARAAADRYPQKRLIVHFLQPHAPFIGPTADYIRHRLGRTIGGVDPGRDYTEWGPQNIDATSYEDAIKSGIPRSEIRRAYRESVAKALGAGEYLSKHLHGRTVLTADHGEQLGERRWGVGARQWEHPSGAVGSALRKVPWVVLNHGPRRPFQADPPTADVNESMDVKRQLRALGYS